MSRFAVDTFTDTAGTTLTSHVGETGAAWAEHPSFAAGEAVVTAAGRLRGNHASHVIALASGTPASADYPVECDVVVVTSLNRAGLVARFTASGMGAGYLLWFRNFQGWQLFRYVGNAATQVGSTVGPTGMAAGTYRLRLECSGTGATVTVTCTLRRATDDFWLNSSGTFQSAEAAFLTYSDTHADRIVAANAAGVTFLGADSDSTGLHVDNFAAGVDAIETPILGHAEVGGSSQTNISTGFPVFSRFTATESFSATKIRIYMRGTTNNVPVTLGIYADASGSIGSRLGDTGEVTAPMTAGWVEGTLDAPVSIVSGTAYWLCKTHGTFNATMYYDIATATSQYSTNTYSAGSTPATPTSPTTWHTDRLVSIYATGDAEEDTTAPTASGWATDATGLVVTGTLTEACVPASGTTGFYLEADGEETYDVTSWSISGTTITLNVDGPVLVSDTGLTVSYAFALAVEPIEDGAGNPLDNIESESVANNSTATGGGGGAPIAGRRSLYRRAGSRGVA